MISTHCSPPLISATNPYLQILIDHHVLLPQALLFSPKGMLQCNCATHCQLTATILKYSLLCSLQAQVLPEYVGPGVVICTTDRATERTTNRTTHRTSLKEAAGLGCKSRPAGLLGTEV